MRSQCRYFIFFSPALICIMMYTSQLPFQTTWLLSDVINPHWFSALHTSNGEGDFFSEIKMYPNAKHEFLKFTFNWFFNIQVYLSSWLSYINNYIYICVYIKKVNPSLNCLVYLLSSAEFEGEIFEISSSFPSFSYISDGALVPSTLAIIINVNGHARDTTLFKILACPYNVRRRLFVFCSM